MTARGWALFAGVSVVWGMPYLFIKIAVDDGLTPGFVAWSRVALAALVLLPVALKTGALRGLPLRWLVAFAIAEICIPFPLIGFGEQRISSSLAAILIAALPLVIAVLALRFDDAERPTPTRLAGMLIGLAGVAALVGIDIGGSGEELLGAAAVLAATLGYACGPLIVKRRLAGADPLGPVTAAMGIASIILLPFGIGDFPARDAVHGRARGRRGAGPRLLGAGLPALLSPDRRGRPRPGDRDHLRQPGRGAGARSRRAGRERDRRRRGRPAAHPGRFVACHRRPPAARAGRRHVAPANQEETPMPIVTVQQSPRELAQKRRLVELITAAFVEAYGVKPDAVQVFIHEVGHENWAKGGRLAADRERIDPSG